MPVCTIAVCIPTFRRPRSLERCLRSIGDLRGDHALKVIVADNDVQSRQGIAVCERMVEQGFRFPLAAIGVSDRGIAPTRNALVAAAIDDPAIGLIAMIDDDEWAAPDWLSSLVDVQAEYDADVVGGPVLRTFETEVPDYVARANLADFDKMRTGPIGLVDATSNILFAARLFRERAAPWFDLQYALMGCEDMDILLGFKMSGKSFAWASDAIVTEEMPHSRCSANWMIKRAYRIGNTDLLIRMKHRPPGFNVLTEGAKIGGAVLLASLNMSFFWQPRRRFGGVLLAARVVGKIVAIFGVRHREYLVTHGS